MLFYLLNAGLMSGNNHMEHLRICSRSVIIEHIDIIHTSRQAAEVNLNDPVVNKSVVSFEAHELANLVVHPYSKVIVQC